MVTVKPKMVVTMQMTGEAVSHSRMDVSVRDVESTIDEPAARGGTNMGLSPTETLIAALIGCTNVITHKIAEQNGADIQKMDVSAEVKFDRRGVTLQEEIDLPFPEIRLQINMTTDAEDAAVEAMKRDLSRYCPVARVISAAGTKIVEEWNVTRS